MSLKAKIEAVIYAAEEPVTLAQLIGLLGNEAQAELDRSASAQRSLSLEGAFDEDNLPYPAAPDDLNQEVLSQGILDHPEPEEPYAQPGRLQPTLEEQGSDRSQVSAVPLHPPSTSGEVSDPSPGQTARDERRRARTLRDFLRSLLDELVRDYASSDRGLEIREVAGGFRLATKPEFHDAVRGFVRSLKPPLKLTLQALETLAVVAYKQPVTAPEISEIRGVDSGGVLGSLMARKLVTTAGRKPVVGRPILYRTTKDFLLRFGLRDVNELPSIEEFEKMAGELADIDSVADDAYQQERQMPPPTSPESAHADPELARYNQSVEVPLSETFEQEKNSTEPQADGDGATVESVSPDGRPSDLPVFPGPATPRSDDDPDTHPPQRSQPEE